MCSAPDSPIPPPHPKTVRGQLRLGLTCPIVQESDTPIVMCSDGEGLIWVTHHLVDLCWAWKVSGGEEKRLMGQKQEGQATSAIGGMVPNPLSQAAWLPLSLVSFLHVAPEGTWETF